MGGGDVCCIDGISTEGKGKEGVTGVVELEKGMRVVVVE